MKAFAELIVTIVRVGPECDDFGKDYEVAVVLVGDGKNCIVKALTKPAGGFTHAHKRAILKKIRELGLKPRWSHKNQHRETE